MAKNLHERPVPSTFLDTMIRIGGAFIGGAKPLVHRLRDGLESQADLYTQALERRLVALALRGFALFLGVCFIGLGILFTLIDKGGVPRGIAFLGGGLFGLLVYAFLLKYSKESGWTT